MNISPSPSSSRRRRPMASYQKEVDAVENPTELFQRINSGDWDGALRTVNRAPAEASIWVSRLSKRSSKVAWKYLPLHLVCLHQTPPWSLLQALLQAYPQAASAPTQHDGNLPIHYVCESGCDDANVLRALITAFPKCMSTMNGKNMTPIMVCHPRTRNVLNKVLKQVLPSQLAKLSLDSPHSSSRGKDKKSRVDQRNASEFSPRDTASYYAHYAQHEQRQLPDGNLRPPPLQWESPQKKTMNNFNFTYSLSSDCTDTSSSSSTPRSRHLSTLRTPKGDEQMHTLTTGNTNKLTAQFQNFTFSDDSSEKKLCDRILAKAESESVVLRAQIQELQRQKDKLEKELKFKSSNTEASLNALTKVLIEQGNKSRITLFQQKDNSNNPDLESITNAVLTLVSHMERKNEKEREHISSLQKQLSKTDVKHKSALAANEALLQEKQSISNERNKLEAMVTSLEDERETLKNELGHEKERTTSLKVINKSLQEQIDSAIGELPGNEKDLRSQLRFLNADLAKLKDDQANNVESQKYQKQIASLLEEQKSMREKNQTLKDTIRENNEAYSRKIIELEKKFVAMEHSNKKFRQKSKVTTNREESSVEKCK